MPSWVKGLWPCLQHLDLSHNEISLDAAACIAQMEWPRLQVLRMADWVDPAQDGAQLKTLLQSKWPALQELHMSSRRPRHEISCLLLDDRFYRNVSSCFYRLLPLHMAAAEWPQLNMLQLSGIGFTAREVANLAKGTWPLLQQLDLSSNNLTDSALEHLVRTGWPLLQSLNVSRNLLTAAAFTAFCNSKHYCLLGGGQWPYLDNFDASNQRV